MQLLDIWPLSTLVKVTEGSDLRRRLARGAFWSLAGAVIARGLMLASLIVVAREIGRVPFGKLGIILSTVSLFQVFAGFGMGLTATKHVAELRRTNPGRAGRIIVLTGVVTVLMAVTVAALMVALAPLLAARVLAAPELARFLRISAGLLLFGTLSMVQVAVLAGFEAFRTVAKVNFIAGVLSFPLVVAGVYLGGLEGAVWGLVASSAASWSVGHLALRREAKRWDVPLTLRGWSRERGVFWRFSLPAALGGLIVPPVSWIGQAMLVNLVDSNGDAIGYDEMGLFSAGNQWRSALLFLPAYLSAAVLPILSSLHGGKDHRRYMRILWFTLAMTVTITLILFLAISLASPWIMRIYSTGFEAGQVVLVVLAFSACLTAATNVISKAIVSSGRMWWGLLLNLLWALVFLASAKVLVEQGAKGLAWATLISYGFHLVTVGLFTYFGVVRPGARP